MGLQLGAQGGSLERYRPLVGDDLIDELLGLAKALQGLRICHVNATGAGGGVAELLARHVPVLQALGLQADWRLIHGDPEFFTVTKAVHNALQGARYDLGARERGIYLEMNERSAKMLDPLYDVYVIHDPQPAALRPSPTAGTPSGSGGATSTPRRPIRKCATSWCRWSASTTR
jgi:trehalose synthase